MKANTKRFFPVGRLAYFMQRQGTASATAPVAAGMLLLLCIALSVSILPTAKGWASEMPDVKRHENPDPRWLPWIGSWRLVPDGEDTAESPLNEKYRLTITLGSDGRSVTMKGIRDDNVLFEEKIEADGVHRSLKDNDCSGWRSYAWSGTGKRLLFQGESNCSDNLQQTISGISIIDGNGDWLDIQLMKNKEEKTLAIRRYRNVDTNTVAPGSVNTAQAARISAGTSFSIDEVIELSGKVAPEVLESALAELHEPFPINSKQIIRLADSGVSTRIVDLMVALSFPDKFLVEKTTISRIRKLVPRQVTLDHWPYGCRWPCVHPMFPWYWAASIYSFYDYWYLDRYYWPGWYYYSWRYPGDGGDGYGVKAGRLVKGYGYTRIQSGNVDSPVRYARPRNGAQAQDAVSGQASISSSGTSTSTYSGGSSVPSGGSSSSASPSGYSSGGNSSGSAQERNLY